MPADLTPLTTVLVAIDLDAPSRAALELAREQARLENARLLVLHVVTAAAVGPAQSLALRALASGVDPDDLALREARQDVDRFLAATGPSNEHEDVRLEVGSPANVIVAVATHVAASGIVIGSHGRGRFGHAVLGSVAGAVMRHARCRVIAVHDPDAAAGGATTGVDARAAS